ncbi:MAG: phosphoribosylformylglycinamidine cyclo-ligase [Planctomycetes bacterium]|nr:phosphoribosylformylglycinamidine cyclo-ligase [Planctomycetota bacterium]
MTSTDPLTYKAAGVDIAAQDEALERARGSIRSTFTDGVLGDVGSFGGLFDMERAGASGEVLVASADGVGTKLEVAKRAGVYDSVGRDLVQHCINDILVQGARPLFFMDYVGMGRLEPEVVSGLIAGCADACKDHGVALLGGETAEMPGLYADGDFDLAGFIVGSVKREQLLDGSKVEPGQALLGLQSSGLHTNGYSLARKVMFERLGYSVDDRPDELGGVSVGDALLAPHRCYLNQLWPLIEAQKVTSLGHITGGGLVDNLPRVLGGHDATIDKSSWVVPALFRLLCDAGSVPENDAYQAFNMGIGIVLSVPVEHVGSVRLHLEGLGEEVYELGEVTPSSSGSGQVRWA